MKSTPFAPATALTHLEPILRRCGTTVCAVVLLTWLWSIDAPIRIPLGTRVLACDDRHVAIIPVAIFPADDTLIPAALDNARRTGTSVSYSARGKWFPYWMLIVLVGTPTAALWAARVCRVRASPRFRVRNLCALIAASALLAVFTASGKWRACGQVSIPTLGACELAFAAGQIRIWMPAAQPPRFAGEPWLAANRDFYLAFIVVPQYETIPGAMPAASNVFVSLLPFALISWGWLSWRLAVRLAPRRSPPGHCSSCAYNLAGNASGVCPECGGPIGVTMTPS